jgi:hypothetical protein
VETDFFQNHTTRAKDLRERRKLGNEGKEK